MTGQGPGDGPETRRLPDVEELVLLLRERDARERVFESFPDAVVLTDVDGRIQDANRSAITLFARPAEDLFGRSIGDVVAEQPGGRARDVSRLTRAGLWQGRVEVVRPDGSRLDVLARSLILAGDEEPMHLLVLADPPSDPLAGALAIAEQRLTAIVDSATDAIVAIDRTGRIVVCTQQPKDDIAILVLRMAP